MKQPKVGILASPQGALFELGCAVELFGLPRPEIENWYQCRVISLCTETLPYTAGVQLTVEQVDHLASFDLLVVPHWPTEASLQRDEPYVRHLRRAADSGCVVVSFCSGAFLLAAAGLLNHRSATTHWRYADLFQQRFPQVNYVDNVLYCLEDRIGTSAGSAAGLDLGLEIIRRNFGHRIANQIARRLVMSAQRAGGQSQFVESPVAKNPSKFTATLDWARAHLHQPLSVDMLAEKANMSRRTFDRKFRASFELSANQWLINQRLDAAKQCLEETTLPLDRIAAQTGFNNAITLRHHFNKILGISPSNYRLQFAKQR